MASIGIDIGGTKCALSVGKCAADSINILHREESGRCLGAPDTCDTYRLICPCFVTGEAAGTAAALCAQKGCTPRDLDVTLLQKTLRAHNAFLG